MKRGERDNDWRGKKDTTQNAATCLKHIALSAAEESAQDPVQNPASCPTSNFNLRRSSHVFLFAVCFWRGVMAKGQLSGGRAKDWADVALSALRGIFEALKLYHKMLLPLLLLLLLLLGSHVTVAVVPEPDSESLVSFGLGPGLFLSAPFLFVRHFLMTIVLQYKLHKCAIFAFVYAKT